MYVPTYSYVNIVDWRALEDQFYSLCNTLPHDLQLTIDKLKTIPQLKKDGKEQLDNLKLISSSSTDIRNINAKIITYLIVKLCFNGSDTDLTRQCNVIEELIGLTNKTTCPQQIICSKSIAHLYSNGFMYVCKRRMAIKMTYMYVTSGSVHTKSMDTMDKLATYIICWTGI